MFTRIAFGKVGYVRLLRCVGICLERAEKRGWVRQKTCCKWKGKISGMQ